MAHKQSTFWLNVVSIEGKHNQRGSLAFLASILALDRPKQPRHCSLSSVGPTRRLCYFWTALTGHSKTVGMLLFVNGVLISCLKRRRTSLNLSKRNFTLMLAPRAALALAEWPQPPVVAREKCKLQRQKSEFQTYLAEVSSSSWFTSTRGGNSADGADSRIC